MPVDEMCAFNFPIFKQHRTTPQFTHHKSPKTWIGSWEMLRAAETNFRHYKCSPCVKPNRYLNSHSHFATPSPCSAHEKPRQKCCCWRRSKYASTRFAHNRVPRVNSESNCFMQNCCAAACGWGGCAWVGELHFLVDRLRALEHQIWNTFCGCADGEWEKECDCAYIVWNMRLFEFYRKWINFHIHRALHLI